MKIYTSVLEIQQDNKNLGYHYFDAKTMRDFKSCVLPTLYGGRYFLTSERFDGDSRKYTVRECQDGEIETIGEFNTLTKYQAIQLAKKVSQVIAVYYDLHTVGCYGEDAEGNSWSTFTAINHSVTCVQCGRLIEGGWYKGYHEDEQHYCSGHVSYSQKAS